MKKCIVTMALLVMVAALFCLMDSHTQRPADVLAAEPWQPTRQGGWLETMVFTEQGDVNQAVVQLQANELDVYAYTVSDPALFQTVMEDPSLAHTEAFGGYNELTFNPSGPTFYDGRLNPFSNAKIREAMNWLIDRDKIAQEIYAGLAVPLFTSVLPSGADFGRFSSTLEDLASYYAYNLDKAQTAIMTEMLSMGATLVNDSWYYNGEPVTIIFIIRVEDQRRPIGDYVANQLQTIGFTVDRQYKTRSEASPIWNQSDPAQGLWHIYTGGWIATSISRDDATNFGYFYTPWGSGSPLWQAYNPTPEFQALCDKLWNNDFSTLEERTTLFEQALVMAMNDSSGGSVGSGSLRVWLVNSQNFAPRRDGTTVSSDLVGSITGAAMFPYTARFDGVEGGNMRIAQPGLLVDPWNPVAGSSWTYDQFPIRATTNKATLTDPNTGLEWAQRIASADCVVKEELAVTKTLDWVNLSFTPTITVPEDAWVDWDATIQAFITVGEVPTPTLEANTMCTITYPADLFTTVTWHDGSPLSVGDFILRMILQFDRAKPDSQIYDESSVPPFDAFMSHFRGVKIESIDPLVITTYDDQPYLDVETIASQMTWWPNYSYGQGPWHTLATAIRAEEAEELAFSTEKAGQLGVEWTNFIGGSSIDILENWMNQSAGENYIPYTPTMGQYVSTGEATARWGTLQAWYAARHHFWLGTGPFYVQQASYDPKSLTLAHFDAFPDAAGKWDAFAAHAQPEIIINHTYGAPGSYFNVTGTGFPPDSNAFITANGELLGQLPVDSSGAITFTLSTDQAYPKVYHLQVNVNPSAGMEFTLALSEPVWPREGEFLIVIMPRHGAWLDSMVFATQSDNNQAITQLQANEIDVFANPIADPVLLQTVLEDPDLTQTESYGNYNELTFNPYGPTFNDGRLNPFSNAKIREAMNWLIDRNKIAQEIYGSMAVPKWLPLAHIDADYTRFKSTIDAIEDQYRYNFDQAQATITTGMEGMGATLTSGTWQYNGEPVTVIFIIRVEDQRRSIGDYVADQLEAIGFTVDRQYKTREEASPIWNGSDPAEGQWHIYTGGWISTSISRDDATNFGFFYTPLGSGSPLWQAYNPTPEFLELCEKLWVYDFSTMEERAVLFEQVLAMAMNDSGPGSEGAGSVRLWLVDQISFSPRRAGTTVVSDLAGGLESADMFPYVTRFDGIEGGSLRIDQLDLLVDPWNPIAGSGWLYDLMPQRATEDRGLMTDPYTGLFWPLRIQNAEVVVNENLPITKTLNWLTLTTTPTITVPGEAWVDWDAVDQRFITASEMFTYTLTANSKVTVYYPLDLFSTVTWHDGSQLSVADFVMNMIMRFDPAKPDSPIYDESQVPNLDGFLSHFKGIVIESTNPLVITTYDDQIYLDAEWMVQTWFPAGVSYSGSGGYAYGTAPWHSLTTAIRAEAAGELAFSAAKAGQLGVEWTNLVGGPSLDILENWMNQSASENYIPYGTTMGQYVTTEEATARWAALQAWYAVHQHFWLGTGPLYVDQVSYDLKSLTLIHFDAYPDATGYWDAFAAPDPPDIVINHTNGAPGSYFNIHGAGFSPDSTAFITVNGKLLDETAVDSGGAISFTLSTDQANPGLYHLRVSVNPSAGVQFTLDMSQPMWPREGDLPIVTVPSGLTTQYIHLPLVNRN